MIHGERERLDGEVGAVAIDDQAGQAIGFAPDEAAQRVIEAPALAVFDGLADAAGEEVEVEILAAPGEAAGDNLGERVVDGRAERAVAKILEGYDIAGLWIAEGFPDFGGVNPFVISLISFNTVPAVSCSSSSSSICGRIASRRSTVGSLI